MKINERGDKNNCGNNNGRRNDYDNIIGSDNLYRNRYYRCVFYRNNGFYGSVTSYINGDGGQ